MADAALRTHNLHNLTHFGLRITIGVLFIIHSIGKFDVSSKVFFSSVGLPANMAFSIGLLELGEEYFSLQESLQEYQVAFLQSRCLALYFM